MKLFKNETCSDYAELMTPKRSDCKGFSDMYKLTFVLWNRPDYPKGCFIAPSKMPSKDAVFWNQAKTGKRNVKAEPLCLIGNYVSVYSNLLHVLNEPY